jgi:hypothetical protein
MNLNLSGSFLRISRNFPLANSTKVRDQSAAKIPRSNSAPSLSSGFPLKSLLATRESLVAARSSPLASRHNQSSTVSGLFEFGIAHLASPVPDRSNATLGGTFACLPVTEFDRKVTVC